MSATALYKRIAMVIAESRAFVRSGGFFGPDRRRRIGEPMLGGKREADMVAA